MSDDINNLNSLLSNTDNSDEGEEGIPFPDLQEDDGEDILEDTEQEPSSHGGRSMIADEEEREEEEGNVPQADNEEEEDSKLKEEKPAMVQRLLWAREKFGKKVRHLRIPKSEDALYELSDEELNEKIEAVRRALGTSSNFAMYKMGLDYLPNIYENAVNKFVPKVDITGFSEVGQSEEYKELADELAWEYASFSYQRPEMRFLMMMAKNTYMYAKLPKMDGVNNDKVKEWEQKNSDL